MDHQLLVSLEEEPEPGGVGVLVVRQLLLLQVLGDDGFDLQRQRQSPPCGMPWRLYKVPSLRHCRAPCKVPRKPMPHAQNGAGDSSTSYNIFTMKIKRKVVSDCSNTGSSP